MKIRITNQESGIMIGVLVIILASCFLLPDSVHAQSFDLIVCDGGGADPCTFADLITLMKRIINALVIISTFLATAAFAWAGFLLLTSGGSEGGKDKAKKIFTKVLIGYLWILAAWVIVYTIMSVLVEPKFIFSK